MSDNTVRGWKITRVDGTTRGGFRWPLPMPGSEPVTLECAPAKVIHNNTTGCPEQPGDGFCAAPQGDARGVSSGGVPLSHCIGLDLSWSTDDVLGHEQNGSKVRLAKVTVHGIFDPLALIRQGVPVNLSGASLSGTDLSRANLSGANLSEADLYRARADAYTRWPDGFDPTARDVVVQ